MGKAALIFLALASSAIFLLLYGSQQVEAACRFDPLTTVYEKAISSAKCDDSTARTDHGRIGGTLFGGENNMIGYNQFIPYIQEPSSCNTAPLVYAKDKSNIESGRAS
jgi:hypothetical protein